MVTKKKVIYVRSVSSSEDEPIFTALIVNEDGINQFANFSESELFTDDLHLQSSKAIKKEKKQTEEEAIALSAKLSKHNRTIKEKAKVKADKNKI